MITKSHLEPMAQVSKKKKKNTYEKYKVIYMYRKEKLLVTNTSIIEPYQTNISPLSTPMHAFVQIFYIIPLDTSVKFYLIDLFLNQKYVVGTQKKPLNKMVLWNI